MKMIRELNIKWIKWIDCIWLKDSEIKKVLKNYPEIHELDIEACLEWNQKSRIDIYDEYNFIVYDFPKYNSNTKIYDLNEFNIFISKEYLITFRKYPLKHIDNIFDKYDNLKSTKNEDEIKFTSWFILYEITQSMLEKMFNVINNVTKDIKFIEKEVFDWANTSLVKDIMIKKRNILILKNMFKPQVIVLKHLENTINKIYDWEMEVYFEDLEDKMEQIVNWIMILSEYIDTVEDAFKSIINIKTNNVIKILTIFTAFMMPLTLITSFYWMNIDLPLQNNSNFVFLSLFVTIIIMTWMYLILKKRDNF